jgi:hypothetical protein
VNRHVPPTRSTPSTGGRPPTGVRGWCPAAAAIALTGVLALGAAPASAAPTVPVQDPGTTTTVSPSSSTTTVGATGGVASTDAIAAARADLARADEELSAWQRAGWGVDPAARLAALDHVLADLTASEEAASTPDERAAIANALAAAQQERFAVASYATRLAELQATRDAAADALSRAEAAAPVGPTRAPAASAPTAAASPPAGGGARDRVAPVGIAAAGLVLVALLVGAWWSRARGVLDLDVRPLGVPLRRAPVTPGPVRSAPVRPAATRPAGIRRDPIRPPAVRPPAIRPAPVRLDLAEAPPTGPPPGPLRRPVPSPRPSERGTRRSTL